VSDTVAALAVLRATVHAENAFLIELERYRDAMYPTQEEAVGHR
jgi:hypothetical protein